MRLATILGLALALWASPLEAQARKVGEQTTGMTKQCFYEFAGSSYVHTVRLIELCPLTLQVSPSGRRPAADPAAAPAGQYDPTGARARRQPATTDRRAPALSTPRSVTAFKTGEQDTGSTKQCFYNYLGNTYTQTVPSYRPCPMSIEVSR